MKPVMPPAHLEQLEKIDQNYWWHRVRWRIVRWCIRRYAGRKAFDVYFDIGSGGGGMPGLLSSDFSFGAMHLFDQHVPNANKLAQGPMQQNVVDLESFDWRNLPQPALVTCLDVLEHLRHPEQLLRDLRSVTGDRPPCLIVTVPALKSLWSAWDEAAGHHRRYNRTQLVELLQESGWRVDHCTYFFQAAVLPVLLRRSSGKDKLKDLKFPELPHWVNGLMEQLFWGEFRVAWRLGIPFGTSLVAVAH